MLPGLPPEAKAKLPIGDVYSMKLQDMVYEAAPEPMSQEMALYNFYVLQLFMDNFYGLKEEHRIPVYRD